MDQITQKSRTQGAALERKIEETIETGKKGMNISLAVLNEIIEDRAKANTRKLKLGAALHAALGSFIMILLKLLPSNNDLTISQFLSILGNTNIIYFIFNVFVTFGVFSVIANISVLPDLFPKWIADCKTKTGRVFVLGLVLLVSLCAIYFVYKLLPLK